MKYLARKHYRKALIGNIVHRWREITIGEIRAALSLKYTEAGELEISRIKQEYELLIGDLKGKIQEKLKELQFEEETHRQLFGRYQDLVTVSKVDPKP